MSDEKKTNLTLGDLAIFTEGRMHELHDDERDRLAVYVRHDPRLAERFAQLRQIAEDAGLDPDQEPNLLNGWDIHEDAKKLLDAEKPWNHPADVLDPDGGLGIEYAPFYRLLSARLAREETENPKLAEVVERLRVATEEQARDDRMVARCAGWLRGRKPKAVQNLVWQILKDAGIELEVVSPVKKPRF